MHVKERGLCSCAEIEKVKSTISTVPLPMKKPIAIYVREKASDDPSRHEHQEPSMKVQTKFNIGDKVKTPISLIPGEVKQITFTKSWRGRSQSEPFAIYVVEMCWNYISSCSYCRDTMEWDGRDLEAA
jgi:hypothetical protein